ncbi:MAG TPA: ribonuclease III [Roseiarcus sp.]|nr:ribonuclease III [Roseiarcus sp.]
MAKREKASLVELEAQVGYRFKDVSLVQRALTHLSATATTPAGNRLDSYQRLEFLGDRVLGLVVADMLYAAYPEAGEGELSIRLAALVRREACAEVAAAWGVGPHLRLGLGEAQAGGRQKTAILADACESLIGAVFLDGGFAPARALVERAWAPRMRAIAAPERDAKTALQEWTQARALAAPAYDEIERSGPDHAPKFTVQVSVEGFAPAMGTASSKRAAEQAAAKAFISRREEA